MDFQRTNGHSVSRLTAHIVWVTKYRYAVLEGDIKVRCRTILIQICEAEDIQILKGFVFLFWHLIVYFSLQLIKVLHFGLCLIKDGILSSNCNFQVTMVQN